MDNTFATLILAPDSVLEHIQCSQRHCVSEPRKEELVLMVMGLAGLPYFVGQSEQQVLRALSATGGSRGQRKCQALYYRKGSSYSLWSCWDTDEH